MKSISMCAFHVTADELQGKVWNVVEKPLISHAPRDERGGGGERIILR